jgi:hypothetical protein
MKLWRPPPRWAIRRWIASEWVPLAAALDRIQVGAGARVQAWRALREHALAKGSERIELALRHVSRDGSETISRLPVSFWRQLEVPLDAFLDNPERALLRGTIKSNPLAGGEWHYFVRRNHLDEHYPAAVTSPSPEAESEPPPVAAPIAPPSARRKPGPRPEMEWRIVATREAIRLIKAGEEVPTAAKMYDFVVEKCGWEGDVRTVQKFLKSILP